MNWVLKDVSFTIEPAEGSVRRRDGRGNLSLNLIGRYYDVQKGRAPVLMAWMCAT